MAKSLGIIARGFGIIRLQESVWQDILVDYWQLVKEPTHVGSPLFDHAYIDNSILEEIDISVLDVYFILWTPSSRL